MRFFSVIVIFAVLLVGGGWVYMKQAEEHARTELAESLGSARRTFAEKARSALNETDDAEYLRQIKAALGSYEDELKSRVYAKKPEWRAIDAYPKQVEATEQDDTKKKSMLEGYGIVKDAYDTLKAGNWRPVLTKRGEGDTRLDLYTLDRIHTEDGQPLLEGKFFFWGIQDTTNVSWGQLTMRIWKLEESRGKEVEKVLGRTEGDAQPHIIIQAPTRYISFFPSFVSIGTIWMPLLPREAKYVDLTYAYRTRGASDSETELKWEKLEVPESWKVDPGQTWEASEIEATEDEIAGREGKEEAPSEK